MNCDCQEWSDAEANDESNCYSSRDWMYCPFCGDELKPLADDK